jgi:hypothetical protein
MRTEYFLTCKKNYHSNSGNTFLNLFKKATFAKGKKYKIIKDSYSGMSGIAGVGGHSGVTSASGQSIISNPPYSTTTSTTSTTMYPNNGSYMTYNFTSYSIDNIIVTENFVSEYFYTLKEERHLKLMRLKKLSHEEEVL